MRQNFQVVIDSATGEDFDVVGTLHVLTRADATGDTPTVDVYANLSDTTAVGRETGSIFRVAGAQNWFDQDPQAGIFAMLIAFQGFVNKEAHEDRLLSRLELRMSFSTSLDLLTIHVLSPPCEGINCDSTGSTP